MKFKNIIISVFTFPLCTYSLAGNHSDKELIKVVQHQIANMVFVEGGEFEMGDFGLDKYGKRRQTYDSREEHKEYLLHKVKLDSFYISKFEVNNWEMKLFIKHNQSYWKPTFTIDNSEKPDNLPANEVFWQDANKFCSWLSDLSGLPFDLPTEAQWEYAARNRGEKVLYANATNVYQENGDFKSTEYDSTIHHNTKYDPNPLGLYNMTGNVSEWVKDFYSKDYYQNSPYLNPKGPNTGKYHISRGGYEPMSLRYGTTLYKTPLIDRKYRKPRVYNGKEYLLPPAPGFRCAINISAPDELNNINSN
ncbi:formylglycine-generating enzyme family protein [Zooshikella harenae]|uniref:SUMF1/EgtB/PvdO family nonheme iron enzyme n=1 Tax=Zooshikella harenae TaxID=2827238 RepID=A0ABS5ZJ53_9GAMM|nr:SUMF1/EgtB/PvdO family nonheme iron enzyme [Zooshikella harenae]MBU2713999.1 SUMF1/EgtB/PvdO family nonheme iron enzyme [Zooshikella harenae]